MTCRVPSPRNDAVTRANKTPPPLPTTPPDTPCAYNRVSGVYFALPPPRTSTKNIYYFSIFRIAMCAPLPNRATSRCGSSGRFDGDIRNIIIDVSLLCRRVATHGRGCRPPRIDFRRNTTCSRNAPASTASPDAPITPPLARGHLLMDGQHPKRVHRWGVVF